MFLMTIDSRDLKGWRFAESMDTSYAKSISINETHETDAFVEIYPTYYTHNLQV